MALYSQPFAFNTGTTIPSTTQVGDLAIGLDPLDYSSDYGGVKWFGGPNEDIRYIIANARPNGQPVPSGVTGTAKVGFYGSKFKTEQSFLDLANYLGAKNGQPPFPTAQDAQIWLNANGYYTSYSAVTPTPTPSPTPTGVNQLIDPIIVGIDEYLQVGIDEYLMFVDPVGPSVTPTPTATPTETPTNTPTPTVTNTGTPTETPTSTPTPTVTNTGTPTATSVTPTPTPTPVTGYGYNLVVLPYQAPTSGNTIFPTFGTTNNSGTTNPNTFTTNGVYWNKIDNTSVDRTNYYSGMTGVSVTAYFTQNGNTAIYSGSTIAFTIEGPPGQESFNYSPQVRPNQLVLIQSASTNFVTGQTVFISYVVN